MDTEWYDFKATPIQFFKDYGPSDFFCKINIKIKSLNSSCD